jgi:hypothetical protein
MKRYLIIALCVLVCAPQATQASSREARVDLSARGSDNTLFITDGDRVPFRWKGVHVKNCVLSYSSNGDAESLQVRNSGRKTLELGLNGYPSRPVIITCEDKNNSGTYVTDTITVEPASASPYEDLILTVIAPKKVTVGKTYPIVWKNGSRGSLKDVLASRDVYGQLNLYSEEKNADGTTVFGQVIEEEMTEQALMKGKGSWTVGSLGNSGEEIKNGRYYLVLNILERDGKGGAQTLGMSVSKLISVTLP